MVQLVFNDNFDSLMDEPIKYWKKLDDIPGNIKDFIVEKSNSLPIFEKKNNKYYCPKCVKELEQNKCPECSREFMLSDEDNRRLEIADIKEIREISTYIYYYVFDVVEENVLLYLLEEYVDYSNPLTYYPYKSSRVSIEDVYQIFPLEIVNLKTNQHVFYEKLEKIERRFENDEEISDEEFNVFEKFDLNACTYQYVYVDNLDKLENTKLYRYSNIWKLKDYFNNNSFNLASLTYYPVYYKEFEYLVKMGFYELAVNSCYLLKYKGNFKNTFGVDKKYYPFMKEINIDYGRLLALRICPTRDLKILDFIVDNLYLCELILKYVDFYEVQNYFKKQELSIDSLHEYADYIRCCEKMKLDLKDRRILFPKNFIEQHDKITKELIIADDPQTDERIKNLANVLLLNKYEDDKYIIFPADGVENLIDESSQQANCVRTYCDMVSNNECQIYFMRHKDNVEKSFVTIEVRNGIIVQAKTKFNKEPTGEVKKILESWEQSLIPVVTAKDNI